jgi:glycosyltransferase involved in cell wall biosynthesis
MAVANTANRLFAAGHTVTVLATDCGYQGRQVSQFVTMSPEVSVHIFPVSGRLNRRLYRSPALEQWVAAHVDEFDVLDIHGIWSASGSAIANIFHERKKPYVLTPHGTMTRYDWQKSALRRRLFFRLGFDKVWRNADAIRFLSQGEARTSYYPAKGHSTVIPNGIDLEDPPTKELQEAARANLGIAAQARVLLFLGRITHQKGVKEALAAFEIAANALPDLFFLLVGPSEGIYGEEVMTLIQKSPVGDRIVSPGAVTGSAKSDCFRAADAFISLSHNEGMSLALLESLSYGLPIVLTESSNLDHFSEYEAGIVTSHDPEEAARAILKIMQDTACREHAGSQARRLAQDIFGWSTIIPRLAALYQSLIETKHNT